jgi:hypothetical protein
MAYIFRRGASIPFTQTYYDSTGGLVTPTSVRVWVTYGTSDGFPYCAERETTNFALTNNTTTLEWEGSWSSTAAAPGWVYYHIKAAGTTLDQVDGAFELRGNPANTAST